MNESRSDDAAEIAKDLDDIEQSAEMMALGQAIQKVQNSDEMKALGEAIKKLLNNEDAAKLVASAQAIFTDELKSPQVGAIMKPSSGLPPIGPSPLITPLVPLSKPSPL
ncbi:unnamed protein product [Boreogadus saida]